ncbi:MAG: zinc ribbon domain-containing protein [Planctomycetes bacterium]|nr:zinc ribbon domain-containing protein [Planctomycetota bacterium]
MPTYEYECGQCGDRFEQFQNMSDKPLTRCPNCGGEVQRLIGAGSAVLFRHSGSSGPRCDPAQPCCGREHRATFRRVRSR